MLQLTGQWVAGGFSLWMATRVAQQTADRDCCKPCNVSLLSRWRDRARLMMPRDLGLHMRAGDGNRTRTISLGMSMTAAQTSQIAGRATSWVSRD